jgi:hypothetical protein
MLYTLNKIDWRMKFDVETEMEDEGSDAEDDRRRDLRNV